MLAGWSSPTPFIWLTLGLVWPIGSRPPELPPKNFTDVEAWQHLAQYYHVVQLPMSATGKQAKALGAKKIAAAHNVLDNPRPTYPEHRNWYNKCPLQDVDVMVYTGSRDVFLLPAFFTAAIEFLPCWNAFHVFVPRDELAQVQRVLPTIPHLRVHSIETPRAQSQDQNWKKLNRRRKHFAMLNWCNLDADQYTNATFIMFLDTDSVLQFPVTCPSLFDRSGRPLWYYWTHFPLFEEATGRVYPMPNSTSKHTFMSYFPVLFPTSVLPLIRADVARAYDAEFSVAISRDAHSQFDLIGHKLFLMESPHAQGPKFHECIPTHRAIPNTSACLRAAFSAMHLPYPWPSFVHHRGAFLNDLKALKVHLHDTLAGRYATLLSKKRLISMAKKLHRHGTCFKAWQYLQERKEGCSDTERTLLPEASYAYLDGYEGIALDELKIAQSMVQLDPPNLCSDGW